MNQQRLFQEIEEHVPELERRHGGRGRPRIEATSELLNRSRSDSSLRRICGFTVVPSAATFSRRLKDFSEVQLLQRTLPRVQSSDVDPDWVNEESIDVRTTAYVTEDGGRIILGNNNDLYILDVGAGRCCSSTNSKRKRSWPWPRPWTR